jgi:beta-mannosidase
MRRFLIGMIAGLLVLGVLGAPLGAQSRNLTQKLDQGWRFRKAVANQPEEQGWLPAAVPGDVHLDLLANRIIGDPFYRDNESKLQWIEKEAWEYGLNFEADPALLKREHIDLVFDGLDGSCEVWLNGKKLLTPDNAFRTWRIPVKGNLHAGTNHLWLLFLPPLKAAEAVAASDPWRTRTRTEEKTYIRKPAYEFGWDWGPRFVTSGVSKPVRLEGWDKLRIVDFHIRQRDVSREVAHLDAEVEVEASADGAATLYIDYARSGDSSLDKTPFVRHPILVHKGRNTVAVPIEIRKPALWFPVGYGDQALYEFNAGVYFGQARAEERTLKVGLRSIVLRRDPDKWGRSFELQVNGIPVFAKGADVIPFDSFPSRVTTEQYRRVLESARDANMNMVRHWGGGYYESDEFYSICDELGLMVWQDFMYGNDWQPGTYAFKQQMAAEAEEQVRRLRNHPSIVLWSGNNETEIAYHWGARDALPADVRMQMWQDYLTEFSGILPTVVARLTPETPYWPSSPSSDYEPTSASFVSGDAHDWEVWHGRVPFTDYEKHHWRFVTEFGFQSFPEWKTVESFTQPEDRTSIFTPVMLAHQKNNEGNAIIRDYIAKDYPEPKDFPSFLYVSQVLQAEGIRIGAEHFRRSRPETMGSIFWQLNDCWPVASWSSIDYYGRWKALQYYAKRFYAPVLVSPHIENGAVRAYIVSDSTAARKATLRLRLMDFNGKALLEEAKPVEIAPLSSQSYLDWPLKKLADLGAKDTSRVFVVAEVESGGKPLSRNLIYLAPVREIRLPAAALKAEISGSNGNYLVRVTAPVLARSVFVSFGELDATLGDNYFDLLPGETAEISVRSAATLEQLRAQMKVISLADAFDPSGGPGASVAARR